MFVLVLVATLSGSLASKSFHDVSIFGFSNFVSCNVGPGVLWYTAPESTATSVPQCSSLSNYHRNNFKSHIEEIRRLMSVKLTRGIKQKTLICVVIGDKLWPKINWFVNNSFSNVNESGYLRQVIYEGDRFKNLLVVVNYLHITDFHPTFYECKVNTTETCKRDNHPAKFLQGAKSVLVNETKGYKYSFPSGKCQPTRKQSKGDDENFVYVSKYFNLASFDEFKTNLTNFLRELLMSNGSACYKNLVEFVSYYVLPSCLANETSIDGIIPPCKEQCSKIRMVHCFDNWAYVETKLANFLKEFQIDWVGCTNLPSILDDSRCWSSMYRQVWDVTKTNRNCYRDSDRHYVGQIAKTIVGEPCQRWDSLCPHYHLMWPEFYPELNNAENFCRNPDGRRSMPWCYTSSNEWNYCGVPQCTTIAAPLPTVSRDEGSASQTFSSSSIAVLCLGLFAFVVCVSVCSFYYRGRYKSSTTSAQQNIYFDSPDLSMRKLFIDVDDDAVFYQADENDKSFLLLNLKKYEFPRNDLVYLRTLAKNSHRIVYESGFVKSSKNRRMPSKVAVKSLQMTAERAQINELRWEASAVLDFNHENVVKLLAVCFVGRPVCLIFEFLEYGDMEHFLRRCSTSALDGDSEYCDLSLPIERKLVDADLYSMAVQVARGMEHVSHLGYVHRDLAARNCLVGVGLRVKISDFGMCRRISPPSEAPFFVGSFDELISVRWAAPEIHRARLYSTFSDVWAYGVVLWEMCTFGLQPYYGMSNSEAAQFVCDGNVLTKPEVASDDLYSLMIQCWNISPKNRLNFANISQFLLTKLC